MLKDAKTVILIFILCISFTLDVLADCGNLNENPDGTCVSGACTNPDFSQSTGVDAATYCNTYGCSSTDLNRIPAEQKQDFWNNANLNNYDYTTITQNGQYLDVNNQKMIEWRNNLPPQQQAQYWRDLDQLGGNKNLNFFEQSIQTGNMQTWMQNYEPGDIARFMQGLTLNEQISAIRAFLRTGLTIPETNLINPTTLSQATQTEGIDTTFNYPTTADITIGDYINANTNTINKQYLTTGTHTITINTDNTINIQNQQIKIQNATQLTIETNNLTIGKATIAQITTTDNLGTPQTTTIVNAKNLTYQNGKITVESASLILEDFAITQTRKEMRTPYPIAETRERIGKSVELTIWNIN